MVSSTATGAADSALPASPIVNSRFKVGFATDIGRKRSQNQDNLAVAAELGLFMVADGMGGHQGGEIASAIATQAVPQRVRELVTGQPLFNPAEVITLAIQAANNAIFKRALDTPSLNGMGTTTTALIFKDRELFIGHVGDSRCYLFRSEGMDIGCWQVTRDHSLVQEKLRAGLITRAEIKTDRMKNVITRSVGFEPDVSVETYHVSTKPGDIFLICSDGLSGLIQETHMLDIVKKHLACSGPEAEAPNAIDAAVRELIQSANNNGGDDNITSVVIEVL